MLAIVLIAAQGAAGVLTGTVRDAGSGEPLSGAVMLLTDLNRRTVTDAAGGYRLERLPAGPHHLLIRRIGFAPREIDALVPGEGTLDVVVALGAEPVRLVALDVGLEAERRVDSPDRAISMRSVRAHPLLAEPDVFAALGGGAVALRPEAPSGLHVRGGEPDQVAYLLDGIPVFSPYHAGGTFSAWNPDALDGLELNAESESWDALSGVVTGTTRSPGTRPAAQLGASTTQLRVTLDGPLGSHGAGYLVSWRSGFPGFPSPQRDPTYIRAETGDNLAKFEAPLGRGRVRVLGYSSTSEVDVRAHAAARNGFSWSSQSVGGDWSGPALTSNGVLRVRAWSARSAADALWYDSDSTSQQLTTRRHDIGVALTLDRAGATSRDLAGIRMQMSNTAYRLANTVGYQTRAPLAALFLEHTQRLSPRLSVLAGVTGSRSRDAFRASPRTWLRWRPWNDVSLSLEYARLHQFSQSLRNLESLAGTVFPADLYVGASQRGVPIARSDQAIVTAQYRPTDRFSVSAEGYLRALHDVVLVAPQTGEPFATGPVIVGSGVARGFAIDASATSTRYTVVASYGQQHVRLSTGTRQYVPEHGVTHSIDAGINVRTGASWSLRLGASARFGRHTSPLDTPFEWEPCNVTDRGCEFVGSPRSNPDSVGTTVLPAYARMDVGIRKEWQLRVAGRATRAALFGTLTNIFGHRNLLTFAPADPATGRRRGVAMRPFAPLVIGIDWTF